MLANNVFVSSLPTPTQQTCRPSASPFRLVHGSRELQMVTEVTASNQIKTRDVRQKKKSRRMLWIGDVLNELARWHLVHQTAVSVATGFCLCRDVRLPDFISLHLLPTLSISHSLDRLGKAVIGNRLVKKKKENWLCVKGLFRKPKRPEDVKVYV